MFNIDTPDAPSVTPPVITPGDGSENLFPDDISYLGARFKLWGLMLISKDTYLIGGSQLLNLLSRILPFALIAIILIFALWYLIKSWYFKVNNNHGHNTVPLKIHLKLSSAIYYPIHNEVIEVKKLLLSKYYKMAFILIWALNFNVVTIITNAITFLFYFVVSFDFIELYYVIINLVLSLKYLAIAGGIPLLALTYWLFNKWRVKHAIKRLEALEAKNKEVLSHRDISTTKSGPMGTNKTLSMTDQVLSTSVNDTEKAAELKKECRKKFHFFPWLLFELDIEKKMRTRELFNWASCTDFILDLAAEFRLTYKKSLLYGYNFKKYGMEYYNGTVNEHLFDVLKDYCKLHFFYAQFSSFIISNYPIREDKVPYTEGNTIKWDTSFFNFDKTKEDSYYSKVLNFDILRMRFPMDKDNNINKSLEYGTLAIAEADKEQANAVETINESKESPFPSPKNDGITLTEKLIRHPATVMGYCFTHIFKDVQRVMSINADTRQLSTLERMQRPSKYKTTLPLMWIEKAIYSAYGKLYDNFEDKYTFYRGDNSLLMHFLKTIDKWLYNNYNRKKSRYSYRKINIECESGVLDGKSNIVTYYLMNAKIFANRYNTATYESYFYERSRKANIGVADYRAYASTTMTDAEFDSQNSYCRLEMTNPDWKKPYIEAENKRKELEKAEAKALAKIEADKLKEEAKKERK